MSPHERTLVTKRTVRPFASLDEATRDRVERDEVVLMDLHGLWWSVPMELTIHEVHGQIAAALELAQLARFPASTPARVHRADWPEVGS